MNRSRRALALAVATAAATLAAASVASAPPALATDVACGATITSSTTLHADVGPCPGDGIVVAADGVVVDLGGFRVFAANGTGDNAGIRLAGVSGVTVTNGTVSGFDAGVVVAGGSGNTVRQLTVRDNVNDFGGPPCNLGDGIAVMDSHGNAVEHNRVVHNGPYGGISLIGDADANVIRNNVLDANNVVSPPGPTGCGNRFQDEGIRIEGPGADDNRVELNQVTASLLSGIGLHGTVCSPPNPSLPPQPFNRGNHVVGNRVSHTAGTSIASGINILRQGPAAVVCPAQQSTIVGNTSSHNQADGIFVGTNSRDNTLSRNTVEDNGLSGIFLGGPAFANRFTNVGPTAFDLVNPDLAPYAEGTDYAVMPGSGSGDVTAPMVAVDLAIPAGDPNPNTNPVDTSTSACEMEDFTAAGFQPGNVALVQRGTCTFVSKVANAIAAGASAVVMFNEGQAGRTTHRFGSVGPVPIPVLSAEYAVGIELKNLTGAGPVVVHVKTNTTNERVQVAPGAIDNRLRDNRGRGNGEFDGEDANPECGTNHWFRNWFGSVNQPCVARGGTGAGTGPGFSGDAPGRLDGGGQEHNRGGGPLSDA